MEDVWPDGGCLVGGLPTRIPGNSVCTTFYLSTLILIFREEEEDNFKKFWRGYIYQRCKNFFQTASLPPCLPPTKGASLTNIHRPDDYPTELVHSICLLRLPILAAFSQIGSSGGDYFGWPLAKLRPRQENICVLE